MMPQPSVVQRAVLSLLLIATSVRSAELADQFRNPPQEARPRVYWTWLHTTLSKKRITFDLEEMKKKGLGGFLHWESGAGPSRYGVRSSALPPGSRWMSPEWREHVRFAFAEADRLGLEGTISLTPGANCGGPWISPDDSAQKAVWSSTYVQGPAHFSQVLPLPENLPRGAGGKPLSYHDMAVFAGEPYRLGHMWYKVEGSQLYPIEDPANVPIGNPWTDVTANMDASGKLTWDVPPGLYRIMRFGYTTTGQKASGNYPEEGGYYADPMRAHSIELNFRTMLGELFGEGSWPKSLQYIYCDSFEVYNADWTPDLLKEFRRRRGYDAAPYLPTLEGGNINTRALTARFREDLEKTRSDCYADYHYGKLRDLTHARGMGLMSESAFPRIYQVDPLKVLGRNDVPMGEFWLDVDTHRVTPEERFYVKGAASAAHIYGKRYVAMEAFTSIGGHWDEDPWRLKPAGDEAFLEGANRLFLHTFSHSPDELGKPGGEYFAGTHINPNVTWWDQSRAWIDYISRCQLLLSQGLSVADTVYYYGDQVPNFVPRRHVMAGLGKGYEYDVTNAEVILERMSVRDGRIVLPDGMSYRVLVMPDRKAIPLDVLRKIGELVKAGATVIGAPPSESSGLAEYEQRDQEVRALAHEIWGAADGKKVMANRYGRGRVIVGRTPREVLRADGVAPDFAVTKADADADVDAIHRRAGEMDIYFVVNRRDRWENVQCAFRTAGKAPELWMSDTGERVPQYLYSEGSGVTTVPLRLAPHGSVFVVFRASTNERIVRFTKDARPVSLSSTAAPVAEIAAAGHDSVAIRAWQGGRYSIEDARGRVVSMSAAAPPAPFAITGPWTVTFTLGCGAPESAVFDKLTSWTERPEQGIRFYSGTATYSATFDVPEELTAQDVRAVLDLGTLANLAEVRLNGKDLGVLWKPPYRTADLTGVLRKQGNRLEVRITNLWTNRLIGDESLPEEKRFTRTNMRKYTAQSPLRTSGLLGPVRIVAAREVKTIWRSSAAGKAQ